MENVETKTCGPCRSAAPSASNEQLALGIMAAILVADPQNNTIMDAVTMARAIMDTIYKTEPE